MEIATKMMVKTGSLSILFRFALYVKQIESIGNKQSKYYAGFDRPAFNFFN